jgi:Fasciclin domain
MNRNKQIEFAFIFSSRRFLSSAEIASSIIGSNYTFFVPSDDAFEKYGFDLLPDETLSSEKGIKMILNHFVKGRLYDRDLLQDEVYETVGGKPLKITRGADKKVMVNRAKIVESEVFVYNLGTMFYIDDVLYPEILKNEVKTITQAPNHNKKRENESSEESFTTEMTIFSESEEKLTTKTNREPTTSEYRSILSSLLTTRSDVELIPSEFSMLTEDFSVSDSFVTPPRALPLSSVHSSPPK